MFRRILRDRRGNVTVLSAFLMTGLIGSVGLVADFGNGLLNHMQDQRSADVAALAGATVYSETASTTSMVSAVQDLAVLNGLSPASVTPALVNSPNGDGNQAVAVTVQTTVPLYFAQVLWNRASLPVSVTAYAEMKPSGSGCVLALDRTANNAITVSGSANVQAPKCDVVSNSSSSSAIDMSGSAQMTTPCTISVGRQVVTSGLDLTSCSSATTDAAATSDPYASLPTPSPSGSCLTVTNNSSGLSPGYYCNGMSISWTTTLAAGTYYVKGNLSFSGGSHITGSNVTIFIEKSGTTAISGSAVVSLSAPTSGTYAGVLFFGDRAGSTANNNNISGASSSNLTGVIYYPTESVTYSGGSSSPSACTEVIGDKITFSGSAYFGSNCAGTGVKSISAGKTVASLVQ